MKVMSRIQRKLKELFDSLEGNSFKLHDFGPRGNPDTTASVSISGAEHVVMADGVLVPLGQKRVMIHCISETGGCSFYVDVGIPVNAEPEIELRERLEYLRANWHTVTYTVGVSA